MQFRRWWAVVVAVVVVVVIAFQRMKSRRRIGPILVFSHKVILRVLIQVIQDSIFPSILEENPRDVER